MFVLDASATLAWCFDDESLAAADGLLDRLETDGAAVPPVWQLEVENALLVAERRKRIDEGGTDRFLRTLSGLPVEVDPFHDGRGLMTLARRHLLSSYGASYLVLAERRGLPLASLDENLAAVARRAGVEVLIG